MGGFGEGLGGFGEGFWMVWGGFWAGLEDSWVGFATTHRLRFCVAHRLGFWDKNIQVQPRKQEKQQNWLTYPCYVPAASQRSQQHDFLVLVAAIPLWLLSPWPLNMARRNARKRSAAPPQVAPRARLQIKVFVKYLPISIHKATQT